MEEANALKREDALELLIRNHLVEFKGLFEENRKYVARHPARKAARKEIISKYRAEYVTLCRTPTKDKS